MDQPGSGNQANDQAEYSRPEKHALEQFFPTAGLEANGALDPAAQCDTGGQGQQPCQKNV